MVVSAPVNFPDNIIVYDGVCKLCNACVNFLLEHDEHAVFYFCSAQSELGADMMACAGFTDSGNTLVDYQSMLLVQHWGTPQQRISQKSDAAIRIAAQLGQPYKLATIFSIIPRGMRNWVYDLVARNRYRWFGRYQSCQLPRYDIQSRFIS